MRVSEREREKEREGGGGETERDIKLAQLQRCEII